MLLEELATFNPKKYALELQQALLDSPYGNHLDVDIEHMSFMDAFDKTNIRLTPKNQNLTVIVVKITDDWDSKRDDPLGPNGIRAMIASNGSLYYSAANDGSKFFIDLGPVGPVSTWRLDQIILSRFIVQPIENADTYIYGVSSPVDHSIGSFAFMSRDEETFWRVTRKLKTAELRLEQELACITNIASNKKMLRICKLQGFTTSRTGEPVELQQLYKEHNITTLKELVKSVDRLYMTVENGCASSINQTMQYVMNNKTVLAWENINGKIELYGVERL
jgi:hypothetical protein